jgi:hypothetical protein
MANFTHQSEQNENKMTSSSNLSDLFKRKNQIQQNSNKQLSTSENLISKKKKRSFKTILSSIVLFLLVIGGVSAMVLTQISQDVRQQASGCTYWNGEAAVEGAVDNRGGIRQECKNGLWDVPADGNLDPSQLIAEKEAARPKRGCIDWQGNEVATGAIDNRGGIRQQCNDGLWMRPADGNLNPNEIVSAQQEQRDKRDCVSWDGSNVSHGAYDNRGGIRQQCTDGLWDVPDDRITNPGQVEAIEVSTTLQGLENNNLEYKEAIGVYNEYCRTQVASGAEELCDKLDDQLKEEAEIIRWQAFQQVVQENIDQVSFAIGGLDEGELEYSEAVEVYKEFCTGSNQQQNSVSVCNSLDESLEKEASRIRATIDKNDSVISQTLQGLEQNQVSTTEANVIFRQYCQTKDSEQVSEEACRALASGIGEIERLTEKQNELEQEAIAENTSAARNAARTTIASIERGIIVDIDVMQTTFQDLCQGSNAQFTSESDCRELDKVIRVYQEENKQLVPLNCYRKTGDSCLAWSKSMPQDAICSDLGGDYTDDPTCGITPIETETISCFDLSSDSCSLVRQTVEVGSGCPSGQSSVLPSQCVERLGEAINTISQTCTWWNPLSWGNCFTEPEEPETRVETCYFRSADNSSCRSLDVILESHESCYERQLRGSGDAGSPESCPTVVTPVPTDPIAVPPASVTCWSYDGVRCDDHVYAAGVNCQQQGLYSSCSSAQTNYSQPASENTVTCYYAYRNNSDNSCYSAQYPEGTNCASLGTSNIAFTSNGCMGVSAYVDTLDATQGLPPLIPPQ